MFTLRALDSEDCRSILKTIKSTEIGGNIDFSIRVVIGRNGDSLFGGEEFEIKDIVSKVVFETSAKIYAYPKSINNLRVAEPGESEFEGFSTNNAPNAHLNFMLFIDVNSPQAKLKVWKKASGTSLSIDSGQLVIFPQGDNYSISGFGEVFPTVLTGEVCSFIACHEKRQTMYELSIFHQRFRQAEENSQPLRLSDLRVADIALSKLKRILSA